MTAFFRQYWKIIIGLVSIFVGGLGFGAVLESLRERDAPPPLPSAPPDPAWVENALDSLEASLGLTPAQREDLRPHVVAAESEIQLTRESALLKFELSLLELHKAIAPKLDPDQAAKLAASQQLLEQRIKQRLDRLPGAEPPAGD